jgi:NADH:ubiquinone oxidoreductase subunit 3 (subunit A)
MDITRFMKDHEARVRERLARKQSGEEWAALRERHLRMIGWMQHERLVHLLVTLAFGIALLAALAMALTAPSLLVYALAALLLLLFIPYVGHYFFLENAVQRWYRLTDEIEARIVRPLLP